ncbi:MAG TPA: hypothetical protein VMU41_17240 [Candidatus Binataceae bacterium]|nr:hypothetical protein [Candidatus Binataceae bacterium]
MHKLKTAIITIASLSIVAPGVALAAKNYCISGFPDPSYKLVGLNFKIPGKGKCTPFNGFNSEPDNADWPTSGTACTSSDGTTLSFTLTTSGVSAPFFEIDAVTLSLPDQTGSVAGQTITGDAVSSFGPTTGISGGTCTTSDIPSGSSDETETVSPDNDAP